MEMTNLFKVFKSFINRQDDEVLNSYEHPHWRYLIFQMQKGGKGDDTLTQCSSGTDSGFIPNAKFHWCGLVAEWPGQRQSEVERSVWGRVWSPERPDLHWRPPSGSRRSPRLPSDPRGSAQPRPPSRYQTGLRGSHTCSCWGASPCPSGGRKPEGEKVHWKINKRDKGGFTFPQLGHLCVPLCMCLWCWRLPGCLNSFPHSSQLYRPPPPLVLRALLTQSVQK